MLKYIGKGDWLPEVPARDLTEEDVKKCLYSVKELLKSGLYEEEKLPQRHKMRGEITVN